MTLDFEVFGVAQQMGSKRAFVTNGRAHVTDMNRNLKTWQHLVTHAAHTAVEALPEVERVVNANGVRVSLAFFLPRPKSIRARQPAHCTAPDLDKLARGAIDALSAICFHDDKQVVELLATKHYARPTEVPHARIRVEPAPPDE